jgi:hypothetical protein
MSVISRYLSNNPLTEPCTTTATTVSCDIPLRQVGEEGVLVTLSTGGQITPLLGVNTTLAGQPAAVTEGTPSTPCKSIGGTFETDAFTDGSRSADHQAIQIQACFSTTSSEQANAVMHRLLGSVRYSG